MSASGRAGGHGGGQVRQGEAGGGAYDDVLEDEAGATLYTEQGATLEGAFAASGGQARPSGGRG
jgi:hypothetical protein